MSILTDLQTVSGGVYQFLLPYAVQFVWIAVLLSVGMAIAGALRSGVAQIAKRGHLDRAADEIGITPLLIKGEFRKPVSTLLGDLVYWIAIFFVVMTVVGAYGIASPGHVIHLVFGYMAKALSAVVLIGVATYFAVFTHRIVLLVVNNVGLSYAKPLARLAQYAVIGLSLLTAVSILGIHTDWFVGPLHVLIVALALALAIAVGTGSRELASGFLTRFFKS